MQNETLTGFLLINKPKDITSFQCIKHLKKLLPRKTKIGHTGTLDPFATGLLIICIGRQATKLSSTLLGLDKEYVVTAKLGEYADTLDYTGTIIKTQDTSHIYQADIERAINELGSEYIQIPPMYSALKHKGKPLYDLARNNKLEQTELEAIIEAKKRTVTLHNLELINFSSPYFTLKAHVSKGTYIRSLANDIAEKINSFATTYELNRTKIGNLDIKDATPLTLIKSQEDIEKHLFSLTHIRSVL